MALPPVKRSGSGFTNLSRYLDANKNSGVGSAVQSGVENNVNQFRSGLNSAQQGFQKDVSGAALGTDANKAIRQEVLAKIGTLGNKNQVAGVDKNADDDVISQQNIDQYGNFRGGEYKGPQELAGGAKFLGQSQNLQGLGNATRTQGGRQGLLQSFVGGNQYTQGQQKLDSLLLGNQANKLGAINRSVQGLQNNTINQLGAARDQANLQAAQNKAFGTESQKLVTDPYNTQTSDLSALVAKYKTDQGTAYDQLGKDVSSLDASSNPYLTGLSGQATWGVDPSAFINKSIEANIGNVITAPQQAQLYALSKLAGRDTSGIPDMLEGDRYDPNKAVGFNAADFNSARTANERNFNQNVLSNYKQNIGSGGFDPDTGVDYSNQTMELPAAIDYYKRLAQRSAPSADAPYGLDNYDFYNQKADQLNKQYQDLLNQYGGNKKFK